MLNSFEESKIDEEPTRKLHWSKTKTTVKWECAVNVFKQVKLKVLEDAAGKQYIQLDSQAVRSVYRVLQTQTSLLTNLNAAFQRYSSHRGGYGATGLQNLGTSTRQGSQCNAKKRLDLSTSIC